MWENPALSVLPALGWALLAFLCGSLPFSVWLPRIFRRRDVRLFGDGNPGATNAYRAAGPLIGLLTSLLAVLAGQVAILAWTHRADLRQRLHLRPCVARRFSSRS